MKKFDLINTPLEGINLIEASAGTGKTYAIAGIFLRLILEKGLSVEKILVVTFTIAAAAELRTRIRGRLKLTRDIFTSPQSFHASDIDELTASLLEKFSGSSTREAAIRDLNAALSGFDEASVATIHSFCGEALSIHAFESGTLFSTDFTPDSSPYINEAAADYWRTLFYTLPDAAVRALAARNITPDIFAVQISAKGIGDPKLIPDEKFPSVKETSKALSALQKAFDNAAAFWFEYNDTIEAEIRAAAENKKGESPKFQTRHIKSRMRENNRYFSGGIITADSKIKYFTSTELNLKAFDQGSPVVTFAGMADRLYADIEKAAPLLDSFIKSLNIGAVKFADRRLPEIKQKHDIRVFDDLITDTRNALLSETGDALARSLRTRFSAALIDEFQDTDPAQYDIFTKIFGTKDSILFQIGDPKQAIYSFRSADIFSYIKASKDAEKKYTLGVNHRSHPELVKSVNSVFKGPENPFIFKDIEFEPVDPSTGSFEELTIDSDKTPPLNFYMMPPELVNGNPKDCLGKGEAQEIAASLAAAEISRLLDAGVKGKALIGEKPVYPSDIAVLVRTHRQAAVVKDELASLAIPSVIYGGSSVFRTSRAEEVLAVMKAVLNPKNPAVLKRALTTFIIGKKSADIGHFNTDDTERNETASRFTIYREEWAANGFMSMMQMLLKNEQTRKRLLALQNGERFLTDILHISELLHSVETSENTGMERLTAYLKDKIYSKDETASDEYQLRLETDEMAVKIVTIHASKGLQYPVVYIPFGWDSGPGDFTLPKKVHDPDTRDPLLVLGEPSDEEELERLIEAAKLEDLAEQVRLLYVAVTRAKYMVNIFWGKIAANTNKKLPQYTSAPAWILHGEGELKSSDDITALDEKLHNYSFEKIRENTAAIAEKAGAGIYTLEQIKPSVYRPRESAAEEKLSAREFSGRIERAFSLFSYSSLAAGRADEKTSEIETVPRPEKPRYDAPAPFLFPKGTGAGSCIHHLFENTDFAESDDRKLDQLIYKSLAAYGFSDDWKDALKEIFRKSVNSPLSAGDKTILLSSLEPSKIKAELEFSFPAGGITLEAIEKIINAGNNQSPAEPAPGITVKNGYMRGFIDLIFEHDGLYYILDWKSNHLGWADEDYSQQHTARAMEESGYNLQYHIYTAALDRFLKSRLESYNYDTDFGGVFYIFVRGITPSTGVFFDRPSGDLIRRLNSYFDTGEVQ